jgi:ribonuclease-3
MYELVEAAGPAHAQEFTVEVVVGTDRLGIGRGSSRQRAEEEAAEAAMAVIDGAGANTPARA